MSRVLQPLSPTRGTHQSRMAPASPASIGQKGVTGRRKSSRTTSMPQQQSVVDPPPTLPSLPRVASSQFHPVNICSFEDLSNNSFFLETHQQYVHKDANLGAVFVQVAVAGQTLHGNVFSMAGCLSVMDLDISASSMYRPVTTFLPFERRTEQTTVALAMLLSLYLFRVPEARKTLIADRAVSGSIEWTDRYAASMAVNMELSKVPQTLAALKAFLQQLKPSIVHVDMIVPTESPMRQLFSQTPAAKEQPMEKNKYPPPPTIEDSEKRENLVNEILATERTYVSRIRHLLDDYATPMRTAARKARGLLGTYETNTLFPTSLDAIVLLNTDFLRALEGSDSDFEFASVLVKNFGDFRRVYARYLETSNDFDQILKAALRNPRFKDFVDAVRAESNAVIGIRELVFEPISRIPRYSLLISSVLAAMTPNNPAYSMFRQALAIVKRIGHMERDQAEISQEVLMKLAGVVSSWPTELIKSSVHVLGMVDCTDITPPFVQGRGALDGNPASLVLLSDRIVLLKRSRGVRLEETLQACKKGELGYRGYVLLDSLTAIEGEECLVLFLNDEPFGVQSESWNARPMRKYVLGTAEAIKFVEAVRQAQLDLKDTRAVRTVEHREGIRFDFAKYDRALWKEESSAVKSPVRIITEDCDVDEAFLNLIVKHDPEHNTFECSCQFEGRANMVCKDVSLKILQSAILEVLSAKLDDSWLTSPFYSENMIVSSYAMYSASLVTFQSANVSPLKHRSKSPTKIVTAFLSRGLSPSRGSTSPERPRTASSAHSFMSTNTARKKSSQIFGFGTNEATPDSGLLGLTTFMEALQNFDEFSKSDFSPASAYEMKQVNVLVSNITKDPRKSFVILGSPVKIGVNAFRVYLKQVLKKHSLSSVICERTVNDFRSHMTEEPQIRRTRLRAVATGLPATTLTILRCVLRYGQHVINVASEACRIPFLLILADMLVPDLCVSSFISTLEVLLEDFDFIFFSFQEFDTGTATSVGSAMSIKERPGYVSSPSYGSYSPSQYASRYTDTATSMSRSPAKRSSLGTPDLITASSTEDTHSLHRSASYSSGAHSLHSDTKSNFIRQSYHISSDVFDNANIFGLTAEETHLPIVIEKALPPPPAKTPIPEIDEQSIQRSNSLRSAVSVSHSVSQENFDAITQAQVSECEQSEVRHSTDTLIRKHSRTTSAAFTTGPLTVKPRKDFCVEAPLPRPPVLKTSGSSHSINSDQELTSSLNLALRYENAIKRVETERALEIEVATASSVAADEPEEEIEIVPTPAPQSISRELLRREIHEGGITGANTIRRVSRQLKDTAIGPLPVGAAASPGSPKYAGKQIFKCDGQCVEKLSLQELELKRYKDLYRNACEEVDVTLDLANEEIAVLQEAQEKGTYECTLLGMLELEKEKVRKLRKEVMSLKEQVRGSPLRT